MRRFFLILGPCLLGVLAASVAPAEADFDWSQWRALPVESEGRQQPLDTLARETLRTIADRTSLADPLTNQRLDPTAAYLSMLSDWRGWEHPDRGQLALVNDWHSLYFRLHEADTWDQMPLLEVDSETLRSTLGLKNDQSRISPDQLANTSVEDARTERKLPFATWARRLQSLSDSGQELTELEKGAIDLARRLWLYQDLRMGRGLYLLPIEGSEQRRWMPLAQLLLTEFDDANDPSGQLRKCQQLFAQARKAFQQHDAIQFNRASEQLLATLQSVGMRAGNYPSSREMAREVAYNQWVPFRFAWVLMLLATVGMWLHTASRWRSLRCGAWTAYVAGLVAVTIGVGMRIAIAGRPPVTSIYESAIFVGAGIVALGVIFDRVYGNKWISTAAATLAALVLVAADSCPAILDSSIRPLEPILRSNFWLVAHVLTITLSYAAFALAMGVANITLGHYLFRSHDQGAIKSLSRVTFRAVQAGVLLLAAGMILGAGWADQAWGHFWSWDPKQVWALVTLLGYLAVLHARIAGWARHRGLAALSVACFLLVVMSWYGVSFVPGTGLHGFGVGDGAHGFVFAAALIQIAFVTFALFRSWRPDKATLSRLTA